MKGKKKERKVKNSGHHRFKDNQTICDRKLFQGKSQQQESEGRQEKEREGVACEWFMGSHLASRKYCRCGSAAWVWDSHKRGNGSTGLGWEDWASCSSDQDNWWGWRSCGDEPTAEGFKVPRTHAKSRVKPGKCDWPSICVTVYESLSFGVLDLFKY